MRSDYVEFSTLVGEVLISISGCRTGGDEVIFTTASGRSFRMHHEQDCCESVQLEEIIGDPVILLNLPITLARVDTNENPPNERQGVDWRRGEEGGTWTFYNIGTARGTVTLRWLGTSNGYYSESVSFEELKPDAQA